MKKTIKIVRINAGVFIIILLFLGCKRQDRNIFPTMESHFSDVKVDNRFYFIKSFGLSSSPTKINTIDYWRLENSEESYFKMRGYIRKLNDSVMIVPLNYEKKPHEQKLFDFGQKKGKAWKVTLKTTQYFQSGDSVLLFNITKTLNDTIYQYRLTPFIVYAKNLREEQYGPIFDLEVSRRNGIISITKLKANKRGFDYKAILSPAQSFIKDKNIMLDL